MNNEEVDAPHLDEKIDVDRPLKRKLDEVEEGEEGEEGEAKRIKIQSDQIDQRVGEDALMEGAEGQLEPIGGPGLTPNSHPEAQFNPSV